MPISNLGLKTYDFNQVVVSLFLPNALPAIGQIAAIVANTTSVIQGYADGTTITCEKQAQDWNSTKGNDGETLRARSNDESWIATLTLLQSSASNDLLSGIRQADLIFGTGTFDFSIKDLSGRTVFEGRECYIQQPPAISFGREAESREWMIYIPSGRDFIGGN